MLLVFSTSPFFTFPQKISPFRLFGGVQETRTPHLDNANVALYQMSYAPKKEL